MKKLTHEKLDYFYWNSLLKGDTNKMLKELVVLPLLKSMS